MTNTDTYVVGRDEEVKRFDELASERVPHRQLNIFGPGGIGKTIVGQRMVQHARRVRRIPVGIVDGNRLDLTSDRVLYGFKETLTEGEWQEKIGKAFDGFEREFRDYLTVNEVLQKGGGVNALFDVIGKIKDPAGFAALIGGAGGGVTETVRTTLSNRFALERYLRGVDRALTATFMNGLNDALDRARRPFALLLDTYEEMEGLDDWICRSFAPALPKQVKLVILGRDRLTKVNFDWGDHGDALHMMPLPELSEDDAKAYLQHFGLTDADQLTKVVQFTGGYPLLLVLVRHLADEAGGWQNIGALESSADRDQIATELLNRILRQERALEVRAFLERGVVARWFDPETVSVILEVNLDEGRTIYEKLRRHSFVERHQYGLKFHDKVRELLLDRLKFTSQSEYDRIVQRLSDYYAEKAGLKPKEVRSAQSQRGDSGGKYVININHAQGVVIGDEGRIIQTFDKPKADEEQPSNND